MKAFCYVLISIVCFVLITNLFPVIQSFAKEQVGVKEKTVIRRRHIENFRKHYVGHRSLRYHNKSKQCIKQNQDKKECSEKKQDREKNWISKIGLFVISLFFAILIPL